MQAITTIGLDIAKAPLCPRVFREVGSVPSWHRGLRFISPLDNVRLMPPAYVKPYVKRQKNDATDAEAICEAVAGPACDLCRPRHLNNKVV